jgi:hypothetical protein
MLKRVSALLLSATVMAACSDTTLPVPSDATPAPTSGRELVAELTCKADVATARIACSPASASVSSGALGDLIIGGQNLYVKLATTGVVNNGTTLSGNVTVQNLTVQPWATLNDTTGTANGVRVFFHTQPTNGVTIANADDSTTYTATKQPYHAYTGTMLGADGILSPNETSAAKNWVFNLNGASSFTYQLYVVATLPDEQGVLKWTQQTLPANTVTYESLNTVWGASSTDVWLGGPNGTNALLHWDGTSWSNTASASDVNQLWGSSGSDIYGVGSFTIKHYNGTSWSDLNTGTPQFLLSVWGSSATDIYAGGNAGLVMHSTGGTFTTVNSLTTGIGNEPIQAIWGTSSTNVYFGGTNVYHYTGTTPWSTVNTGISNVSAIWGSSATDIWMGATAGNMAHLSGGTWTTWSVGSGTVTGIWGTSSGDVYMVNRVGEIWHFNGTNWVKYVPAAGQAFLGVWGSGRTDVWVAGTDDPDFMFKRLYRASR